MGQAKNRKLRNPVCAYCGAATESFDHVPPKCVIPIKRDNLIMVPSCDLHNSGRSGDDEKFAEFIVIAIGRDTPAAAEMHASLKRSFAKNKAKRESFRQRSTYNPALNMYEVATDPEVFKRVIASITRGLWFHHHRRPLGMDKKIKTSFQAGYDGDLKEFFKDMRIHTIGGDGQFAYAFNVLEEDHTISVWWFLFQRKVLAAAFTNTDRMDEIDPNMKRSWDEKFNF